MDVGINSNISAFQQTPIASVAVSQNNSNNSGAPVKGITTRNEKLQHIGVGVCAAAGVAATILLMAKTSKPNPALKGASKTVAEKIKNSYILNAEFNKWQKIVAMGAGSVLGGLAGGAIFDKKENFNAKVREGVVQMFNIATPIYLVDNLSKLGKKYSAKVMPEWGKSKNILKIAASKLPQTAGAAVGLVSGMYIGNKVSNKFNEKVFHKKDDRPIKLKDFSAHIDDIGVAATFVADENNPITRLISKLIPLALIVPGIEVGNKKETEEAQKN